ncbi:RNA polymerase sigma factor SigE [Occultella glacieicola]|uniref:RNA polymerase sigma factor SigE n=1 Tax=Occultella glacieicola TaxID=2518684 RepID=A0ABY2E7I2_9MICO|nr:RNA polymerase sigma factor SigE [Occultella glacieicola]TDE97521.1 RNA polymerase sigma factor SigE [Occultella glacieicola]
MEEQPVVVAQADVGELVGGSVTPVAGDLTTPEATEPLWEPPTWERVVRENSDRVYRLAYRLTGNRADAEDLTQEVFVRVFRSLHSYKPGTFEGWLHRITTNLFLDGQRRKKRIRFDALGQAAEWIPETGERGSPERGYEHENLDLDIQVALDTLKPQYRAAVVLCDIEGLSYEEIAATLGISMGTVRSRIHRGRAQLRKELAHRSPQAIAAAQEAEQ